MAIAKRPQPPDPDKASENFIAQAGAGAGKAPPEAKTSVIFRFRKVFLERIDAAASRHELSRQGWVRSVVAAALEKEGL